MYTEKKNLFIINDNRTLSAYFNEIKDSLLDCIQHGCFDATNVQRKTANVFHLL